jgi:hypothetical protein
MSNDERWLIQKIKSTLQHRFGPPQPPPNTTIVVYHRGTCLGQMGEHIRKTLNFNDCRLGLYEFWIIPIGSRKATINESVATNQTGVAFTMTVDIQYQVSNPEQVARYHEIDLPGDVEKELHRMLQQHAGRYGPLEWERLKQAAETDLLRRRQLEVGVETMNPLVRVTIDSKVQATYRTAFDIRTGEVVHDAEEQSERARLQREARLVDDGAMLDLAKQNREALVFQAKMDRYARVLSQGKVEQFAALLAEPDNATLKGIVEHFEKQRSGVVAERWKFFKELISSDDAALISGRIRDAMKALGMVDRPLLSDNTDGPANKPKNPPLIDDDDDDDEYGWLKPD